MNKYVPFLGQKKKEVIYGYFRLSDTFWFSQVNGQPTFKRCSSSPLQASLKKLLSADTHEYTAVLTPKNIPPEMKKEYDISLLHKFWTVHYLIGICNFYYHCHPFNIAFWRTLKHSACLSSCMCHMCLAQNLGLANLTMGFKTYLKTTFSTAKANILLIKLSKTSLILRNLCMSDINNINWLCVKFEK